MSSRFLLYLCLLIFIYSCTAPTPSGLQSKGDAKIVFDSKIYTFGAIKQDEVVGALFRFRNEGEGSLLITRVEKGCGCTEVRFPQTPVGPGDPGVIEVIFDSKGFRGAQYKTVQVFCNDAQSPVQLSFTAEVVTNY